MAAVFFIFEKYSSFFIKVMFEGHRSIIIAILKVIYHPLYSMNNFVTNKSKLPRDGAQVLLYMG